MISSGALTTSSLHHHSQPLHSYDLFALHSSRSSQVNPGVPGSELMLTASPWGIGPEWDQRCAGPGRCNMTVWASDDSGLSWTELHQLNETIGIDPREAAAYSSMVQVNKTHVALVYERDDARHLSLVYVPLPAAK